MASKPPIRVFVLEDATSDTKVFDSLSTGRQAGRFTVVGRSPTSAPTIVPATSVDVIGMSLAAKGREAVRRFRQLCVPGVPSVVCLAQPDVATGVSLMEAGATNWMSMPPATPSTVLRALRLAADRGRLDREMQGRIDALTAYRDIAEVLANPGSLKSNLRKVLGILVDATGAGRGTIRFPDDRRRDLVLYAAVGSLVRIHPPSLKLAINGSSQCARSFREGTVHVQHNHRPGENTGRDEIDGGVRAALHVPIVVDGGVKATIGLGASVPGFFTPPKMELAKAVGRELGPLVAAAQLRDSLSIERSLREHRDDFISVVSHELRTPMTMMMGFSELLLDGEPDADTRRSWYEMIYSQTQRLARLIDQMLNVSDLQAGHLPVNLAMVDLIGVIKEVVDECCDIYPMHSFRINAATSALAVIADEDMLHQVLRNLVDNAAKFSPEGGPVDIRVADRPGKGLVTVAVEDEGIGVMPGDRERLFQTFSRGSNPEVRTIQGVGLGLYTSKSLSEAMGCQINFSKRRGKGSRFSLDIPMAA